MPRIHLFEFEDFPWFPHTLRESMTDFLSFMGEVTSLPYRRFTQRLQKAMAACGERRLVDLCSGAGGPAWAIAKLLRDAHDYPVDVLLTDLYPNLARFARLQEISKGIVQYAADPVDATQVPPSMSGFRLVCNGFHHLPPQLGRAILLDAVNANRGIAIFEVVERSLLGFSIVLSTIAALLVVTPFIRPFRLSRLFYTYVIPVIPFFVLWDGTVSCLRIYSPDELRELVASLPENNHDWDIGRLRVPFTPVKITYLIGTPRSGSGVCPR